MAKLPREITQLKAQLESQQPTQQDGLAGARGARQTAERARPSTNRPIWAMTTAPGMITLRGQATHQVGKVRRATTRGGPMMGRDRRQRRRRVAAVGGAAIAAKKHRDAKEAQQQEEAAAADQAAPAAPAEPAAAGGLTPEVMEELKQLGALMSRTCLPTTSKSARRQSCWVRTEPHVKRSWKEQPWPKPAHLSSTPW